MRYRKLLLLVIAVLMVLSVFQIAVYAQTNPTITSPQTNGLSFNRGNRPITWSSVSGATYRVFLRDTTVNMGVLYSVYTGTSTSYTIPMKYFYEGHSYKVTVTATVGTTVTSSERTFNISLSFSRSSARTRGNSMNAYTWTPTSNLTGYNNKKTYYANTTYIGIPYSRTTNQCSISSIPWSHGYYFDWKLADSTSGFYDYYTNSGVRMPKYGNDCSGYVSICWDIERHGTIGLWDHIEVKNVNDISTLQKYARLSPGDALVIYDNHTVMIKKIEPINDANGNLIKLKLIVNEQNYYNCREYVLYSDTCASLGYKGVLKDSSVAQDYTWTWLN